MRALKIVVAGGGIGIRVSKYRALPRPIEPSAAPRAHVRVDSELRRLALLSRRTSQPGR